MKAAAIDIGTNSIRLLISDFQDGSFHTLERRMDITRIGKNLDITGNISTDSAASTSVVLKKYKIYMKKNDVEKYTAVGTSAVRKAANSNWFVSYIKEETGIEIVTLTGKEEASLSFQGASDALDTDSRIMVLDIGGGSTEFIVGGKGLELELIESISIGSVNLSERFVKGDKPSKNELEDMGSFIRQSIDPVLNKVKKQQNILLIGVAGTITTIASIDLKLEEYDSNKIHHHLIGQKKILEIYNMLCGLTLKKRRRIMGLQPERADIIIGGTAVLLEVMKILKKDSITVSEHDILDGIIYSLVKF